MKAEELRIGNWVMNGDKPKQVIQINRDGSVMLNPDMRSYVWLSECRPIELSTEILEKAGFEKSGDNEHYFIGHFGFCLVHDGSDWCMKPRINDSLVIAYCKNVHQLQNLYWCLIGSELPLNL